MNDWRYRATYIRIQFQHYAAKILTSWFARITIALEIVGAISSVWSDFSLPSEVYWLTGFLGLFLASFTAYLDQRRELAKYRPDPQILPEVGLSFPDSKWFEYRSVPKRPGDPEYIAHEVHANQLELERLQSILVNLPPEASVEARKSWQDLVNQQQVQYVQAQNQFNLAPKQLRIFLKIMNRSAQDLTILSADIKFSEPKLPWRFHKHIVTNLEEQAIGGVSLNGRQEMDLIIVSDVQVVEGLTPHQFASRLASITPERNPTVYAEVVVEFNEMNRRAFTKRTNIKIPVLELKKLFVSQWSVSGETDLVELALADQ